MPTMRRTGRVANMMRLSSQHLKKARKIEKRLVTKVVSMRLIFSPVAVSM